MNTTLQEKCEALVSIPELGGDLVELDFQELEPLDAPGWWTAAGVVAGVVVTAAAAYGSYAVTAAVVT